MPLGQPKGLTHMTVPKMLVVLSGGQDSITCLHWALAHAQEVRAVFINYGQRHIREQSAARAACFLTHVCLDEINVPGTLVGTSPLVSAAKLEQYADWTQLPGGLEKTFVPLRNLLFLTLAANRAIAWGCDQLVTGVCQEDFGGYPDCRQVFVLAAEAAIRLGTFLDPNAKFTIRTPLMNLSKADSVKLALELHGCYGALGFSHTAYDGSYPPTGKDHATLLRAKGFEQAMVPDPLVVRAYWEGAMGLPDSPNYLQHMKRIMEMNPHTRHWAQPLDKNDEYLVFMTDRLNKLRAAL